MHLAVFFNKFHFLNGGAVPCLFFIYCLFINVSFTFILGSCLCGAAMMNFVFGQMYSTGPQRKMQNTI